MPSDHTSQPAHGSGPDASRLRVRHVAVGSIVKFSALMAVAGTAAISAAIVVFTLLFQATGTIDAIASFVADVTGGKVQPTAYIIAGVACGLTAAAAAVFVLAATMVALMFNLVARFTGGPQVTLTR